MKALDIAGPVLFAMLMFVVGLGIGSRYSFDGKPKEFFVIPAEGGLDGHTVRGTRYFNCPKHCTCIDGKDGHNGRGGGGGIFFCGSGQ